MFDAIEDMIRDGVTGPEAVIVVALIIAAVFLIMLAVAAFLYLFSE